MRINYHTGWHRYLKEPLEELDPAKARARQKSDNPIVAVIYDDNEDPIAFIEINLGLYGVSFLDKLRREYLQYDFVDCENGKVFMEEAIWREFDGESDTAKCTTRYSFKTDGTLSIFKSDNTSNYEEVLSKKNVNISANWDRTPNFGQYENILKKERVAQP